jgi:hypothetical protein
MIEMHVQSGGQMLHWTRAAGCVAAMIFGALPGGSLASDHKDRPFTQDNPASDIGDVFIFNGAQTGGLTMVFTVNPLSGSGAPDTSPSDKIKLDPTKVYQFKLDRDGDSVADLAYKLRATDIPGEAQKQRIELRRATGAQAVRNDFSGDVLISADTGRTTALNAPLEIGKGPSGELLFAGVRRDPFFFDFENVQAPAQLAIRQALADGDGLPAEGSSIKAFGETDMTVVVLEVPTQGIDKAGFWVIVADDSGMAVDRMGKTAVQGIFLVEPPSGYNPVYYLPRDAQFPTVGDLNNAYNSTSPADDLANYGAQFAYRFRQLEVSPDKIDDTVKFYLPDILHWDSTAAAEYPNQRNLSEDSVFWTIRHVNPFLATERTDLPKSSDQPLSDRFPYVAPAVATARGPANSQYMD